MMGRRSLFAGLAGLAAAGRPVGDTPVTPSTVSVVQAGAGASAGSTSDEFSVLRAAWRAGLVSKDEIKTAIASDRLGLHPPHWSEACKSFAVHTRRRIQAAEHLEREFELFLHPRRGLWQLASWVARGGK